DALEVLYLAPGEGRTDRGRGTMAMPAVDLPVSGTGVVLYYPPAHRVTVETGRFRAQEYVKEDLAGPPGPGFPAVGPSIFLVSELTGENQVPKVEVSYQKGGRGSEGGV